MRINQPHTRECFEDKSTYQLILIPLKLNVRSSFKLSTLSLEAQPNWRLALIESQTSRAEYMQQLRTIGQLRKKIRAKKEAEIPEVMSDQAMAMS